MPPLRVGCMCAALLTTTAGVHAETTTAPPSTSGAASSTPSQELPAEDLALGKPAAPPGAAPTETNRTQTTQPVVAPALARRAPVAALAGAPGTSSTAPESAETVTPRDPPRRLPYKGEAVMPGYELQEQPRWWLAVAGGVMFGVGYVGSIGIAAGSDFRDGLGFTAIPVVGPWVALGTHDGDCTDASFDCDPVDESSLAAMGVVQDVGAILLAVGLATSRKVWVRSDAAWAVTPLVGRERSGLQLSGSF